MLGCRFGILDGDEAHLAEDRHEDGRPVVLKLEGIEPRPGSAHARQPATQTRPRKPLKSVMRAEAIESGQQASLAPGSPLLAAVVTVVRHGPARAARVRSVDGTWREVAVEDLGQYVSEAANPGNEKGVAGVEVFAPSELLASGMCLVDTPGLGSVFTGGTEATRAFVPQIDGALVVLDADPPISEDELTLLTEVSQQSREVLLVLNKADRVPARDLQEAKSFTERIVAGRLDREVGPVFDVSAAEVAECGVASRDWPLLHEQLRRLAREAGSQLVDAAEARGRALLAGRLLRDLDEQRDALVRPVAESERRIGTLRQCAEEAERAAQELS